MRSYAPAYSQEALDALLFTSKRQRFQTRAAIEQLCRGVPSRGDYQVRDASGRVCDVTLIDGIVFTYWVDPPCVK